MRVGIQEQDVWQAADALLLAGERPTIERVRQQIGRGSPNTVAPYLDNWFQHLGARLADPQAFSQAAKTAPEPVAAAAQHFWSVALGEAREKVRAETKEAEAALATERERLAVLNRDLEQAGEALRARERTCEEALALARGQFEDATRRAAGLEEQLGTRATQLEVLARELQAERQTHQALRERLDAERADWQAQRRALEERGAAQDAHWAREVDRARTAAKAAEEVLAVLRREAQQVKDRYAVEREALEAERARLAVEHAAEKTRSRELENAQDALQAKCAAAEQTIERLRSEHTEALAEQRAQLGQALALVQEKDARYNELTRELLRRRRNTHSEPGARERDGDGHG